VAIGHPVRITLTYLLICRRTGTTLALKNTRIDATLAGVTRHKNPHRDPMNLPQRPPQTRAT
jgi:hypothetical protein